MIYLDNNASTAPNKNMLSAMVEEVAQNYGNPSSSHASGWQAEDLLDEAREKVAAAFDWSDMVVFTSGGTEANSIALGSQGNSRIFCSTVEHSSVLKNVCGEEMLIPVNKYGIIDLDVLESKLKKGSGPTVVSVMYANNETGVISDPEDQISRLKELYGFVYHVDAVQGFGKSLEFKIPRNADMVSVSGHKFHALKGAGALLTRPDLHADSKPLFTGGTHEFGIRPGTENQSGIFSLGYMADKISSDIFYKKMIAEVGRKRDRFESMLQDVARVNGSRRYRVLNTSNLYFPDVSDPDLFLNMLSDRGVMASGRSACTSGMPMPSRVIRAMYGDRCVQQAGTLRFSLSVNTTDVEIDEAVNIIKGTLEEYKDIRR